MTPRKDWQPGQLRARLQAQTQHGLETGALLPIATDYELVESGGVTFVVRIVANLGRKSKATKKQQKKDPDFNPFLPYEPDLYVTDISETHLCLLNKYNVIDHHLLIVTRAFESQETWLNLADFEALSCCLREIDGFAFYNAGPVAGASQRHKHLQLVPLPMIEAGPELLIDQLAGDRSKLNGWEPTLPFCCAIQPLDRFLGSDLLQTYRQLLNMLEMGDPQDRWQGDQAIPYNLLCTRRWMMVVPRSRESYGPISVNSLGFAGSLLVKNSERLKTLKSTGPMAVLEQVGIPR
ncbi:MAG: phosphorylase [Cyanobacteria bacterium J06554_6]